MTAHPDLGRLSSAVAKAERLEILGHVRDCGACRNALAATDPAALFALLALREPPPRALEAVTRAVETELVADRPSRLDAWRERGLPRALPFGVAAALAALFLVAGLRAPAPTGGPPPVLSFGAGERADVRVTETPGPAQVVDLTVGETQVVMIFSTEMEL